MIPQLVAIDGPLKGAAYAISGDRFTIGRKTDNDLAHADLSLSRQHCTIDFISNRYRLTDHDSQNGTFVNGIPVKERILVNGDQIAVGTSVLVFLADEMEPLPGAPPALSSPIVGETLAIRHVFEFIGQVAPLDGTVLIVGEKGTGKQVAARALHDRSPRARRPFVRVNCAGWSETFLARELFGHEAGAFPGASAPKESKLELAEGGYGGRGGFVDITARARKIVFSGYFTAGAALEIQDGALCASCARARSRSSSTPSSR